MVNRQALAGHYFILPRHIEIEPLPSCVSGSQVTTNGNRTCGRSLTLCGVDSHFFCSTLVLTSNGNSGTRCLTLWRWF